MFKIGSGSGSNQNTQIRPFPYAQPLSWFSSVHKFSEKKYRAKNIITYNPEVICFQTTSEKRLRQTICTRLKIFVKQRHAKFYPCKSKRPTCTKSTRLVFIYLTGSIPFGTTEFKDDANGKFCFQPLQTVIYGFISYLARNKHGRFTPCFCLVVSYKSISYLTV